MNKIIFDKTEKLGEDTYMTFLSAKKIVKLWNNDQIKYIPEIQRGLKVEINDNGEKEEKPFYSPANVKKIKKSILENKFYVSQLTLNVIPENSKIKFNEKTNTIKILEGVLALLDGQHRVRAIAEIAEENPEFDLRNIVFPIKITHYTEAKAQEQFHQFTLGSKISSSRSEYFNNIDNANKIAKDLYLKSILLGRVETVKNNISQNDHDNIVSYATLKNAIELNFGTDKYTSNKEVEETTEYLKDFFKELFLNIPEFLNYNARVLLKEEDSLKCENFAFYGYLSIASYLEGREDWKDLLKNIKDIDFNKTSKIWVNQITKKTISKKKEVKYNIINNSQSRKDIAQLMLKAFKKQVNSIEVKVG